MIKIFVKGYAHGEGYFCKAVGLPSGYLIDLAFLNEELKSRRKGIGRSQRMLIENDEFVVVSGLDKQGKTDGTPFVVFIKNMDNDIDNKPPITALRSGHADLAACVKLGLKDARIVCELASARRTVAYTLIGAICKQILKSKNIFTYSRVMSIGKVSTNKTFDYFKDIQIVKGSNINTNDLAASADMEQEITAAKQAGDSIGGRVEVGCINAPIGLGDFVDYDKRFDGVLAQKMMSIPGVKALSFGIGESYGEKLNSEVADKLTVDEKGNISYLTNNCGGIVAGLTNGAPIIMHLTVKPVPTTKKGVETVDIETIQPALSHYERSDVCIVPNVGVIAENILATTVLDLIISQESSVSFSKFDVANFNEDTLFVTDSKLIDLIDFKDRDVFVLSRGERAKSLRNAALLLKYMADKNLSKTDTVVAVGGGVISDIVGFVASVYKRGIDYINVPTTLLAMVDASIGGKNALNVGGIKNAVGSIYLPKNTVIDYDFLKTNSKKMIQEGFGEIVKCALLNKQIFEALKAKEDISSLIKKCVLFKEQVVNCDLKDELMRRQLNLGHTFGHAFELNQKLPHGIAVLNGIYYETKLAEYLGVITKEFCSFVTQFVLEYFKPISIIDSDKIINICMSDKKSQGEKLGFVFALPHFDYTFRWLDKNQLAGFFSDVCISEKEN